jgi:hypothetical protein
VDALNGVQAGVDRGAPPGSKGQVSSEISIIFHGPNLQAGPVRLRLFSKHRKLSLKMFDVRGKLVRTFQMPSVSAKKTIIHWDGRNDLGMRISPGKYFLRLMAGEKTISRQLLFNPE